MNIYFYIIITALVLEFILSRVSGLLSIRSLDSNLPIEFQDIYNKDKYQKSQEYTKANEKFSLISDTFNFIIIMIVILMGYFNVLDNFVRQFGYESEIVNGIIFFGIMILIQDILSTPFSYYRNFVIEENFGFNKMTIKTFIIDKVKSIFLMAVLGFPIILFILYFFESFGNNAWLFAWALVSGFILILQPLFTTFIAPLFNKFTPLEDGELRKAIESYARSVDFPISRIDVMDGSKRSSHSNAYFSGIGKQKRIALFDTLIEKQSVNEIIAIVAHEVGHYKKKHIQSGIFLSIFSTGIMFFMLSLFIKNTDLFSVFKMEHLSAYGSLIFFQLLFSPITLIISIFMNIRSRKNEFEADKFSSETTGKPENLISGLKKLTVENLGNLSPHPLNVFLNYSHPPVLDRIRVLSKV